jgi:hypothetical protein
VLDLGVRAAINMPLIRHARQSERRPRLVRPPVLLALIAAGSAAVATEPSGQISPIDVAKSVVSALPILDGRGAQVIANLDLTRPLDTKTQWTSVAAVLPGAHFDGADDRPVDGGALAHCFVEKVTPHCTYVVPRQDQDWYTTPIELYSANVVYAGAGKTRPLLMIQTGSAHGADGGHSIFTELFTYDRRKSGFHSVFSNVTGSNNNQKTRFVEEGPLRGDVIADEPSGCCYRITVYRSAKSGRYVSILSYRGHTVYGDGNPLSVSDSEMPEILRRLGLWRQGDALPVPHEGCIPVMRHHEE